MVDLGSVLSRSPEKASPQSEPDLPFVGLDAIAPDSMTVSETVSFGAMKSLGSRFRVGDVLYGRLRPYLNKVWHADREGACSGELLVLQTNEKLDPRFLAYRLHGREFVEYASHAVTGDRPRLDFKQLAAFQTALPPIETQSRIVARIDELFSELDDGEEELSRVRTDLETYRKSLLRSAVTGDLTAAWRASHPASETGSALLQRMLADRKDRWDAVVRNQGKEFPTPLGAGEASVGLPEEWTWATVDQLATVVRGASPRPAGDPRFFGGEIPWITVGSLTRDSSKYLDSVGSFVTDAGRLASRYVEAGTLLLTNSGATLGVPKITNIAGCINDGSVALLGVEEPLKSYLFYFLRTQTERLRALNQGAAQPNLNTQIVREITVPLPPKGEQEKIVNMLDRETQVDDASILRSLTVASSALRQSILAAAFRGELVQ